MFNSQKNQAAHPISWIMFLYSSFVLRVVFLFLLTAMHHTALTPAGSPFSVPLQPDVLLYRKVIFIHNYCTQKYFSGACLRPSTSYIDYNIMYKRALVPRELKNLKSFTENQKEQTIASALILLACFRPCSKMMIIFTTQCPGKNISCVWQYN